MHAFVLCTDGVDVIEGEKERDKKGRGGKEGKKERKKGETWFPLVEVSPPLGGCLDTSEGYLYNPIFEPVPRW